MKKQFRKFLKLGFFPEELPPEFGPFRVTHNFTKKLLDRIDEVSPTESSMVSSPTLVSYPKSRYSRRDFHFINPINFIRLAFTILNGWKEIHNHTNKSILSTSRLDFSNKPNEIFINNPFSDSLLKRLEKSSSKNYVLYADIENFYPTIYTHSIDWALNSGQKRHYSQYNNRDHIGVAIDQDLRRGQDNVTNGVIVGPITSRIASEIIASYFDIFLEENIDSLQGTRYVDDYHVFLNTKDEIEKVQFYFRKILTKFGLKLNEAKFSVEELPEVYFEYWTHFFRKDNFYNNNKINQRELITSFSKAFKLLKKDAKHPALRYLFRVLENDNILQKIEVSIIIQLIHHSIKADPRSVSRALVALMKNGLLNKNLDEYLNHFTSTFKRYSELGCSYEVLWLSHLYLRAGKKIPLEIVKNVLRNDDVTCIAYLLLCHKNGIIDDVAFNLIKKCMNKVMDLYENIWFSPYWLIAYENERQNWGVLEVEVPENYQIFLDNNIMFLKGKGSSDHTNVIISRYDNKNKKK